MAEKTTWIKLDRNIINWRWYQDPNTFRVFIHLLLNANIDDRGFMTETIHRGECVISIGKMAKTLGITYDQARTALTHLKETNEITSRQMPKCLVITVVNYDKYQDNPKQIPSKSQANPTQVPSKSQDNKKYKNKRNKEYIYTEPERVDYGGVCLSDDEWEELKGLVNDDGEFIKIIDRVGDWLTDNPRPVEKHKSVVKTFMRNDGWI